MSSAKKEAKKGILSTESWYWKTAREFKDFKSQREGAWAKPIEGARECDVLVVGAGLSGLSVACELSAIGMKVEVVEAARVGLGASGRNGGQVLPGYEIQARRVIRELGKARAKRLWGMALEGVHWARAQCEQDAPEAFEGKKGLVLSASKQDVEDLKKERLAQESLGFAPGRFLLADEAKALAGLGSWAGGVEIEAAFSVNPLIRILSLAARAERLGAKISENSPMIQWRKRQGMYEALFSHGRVRAKHLILCGGQDLETAHGGFSKKVFPVESWVSALAPPKGFDLGKTILPQGHCAFDDAWDVRYFRKSQGALLFGACESPVFGGWFAKSRLIGRAQEAFGIDLSGWKVEAIWGGRMDFTSSKAPAVGVCREGSIAIQGLGGQGQALSASCAIALRKRFEGDASDFDILSALPKGLMGPIAGQNSVARKAQVALGLGAMFCAKKMGIDMV